MKFKNVGLGVIVAITIYAIGMVVGIGVSQSVSTETITATETSVVETTTVDVKSLADESSGYDLDEKDVTTYMIIGGVIFFVILACLALFFIKNDGD